MDVPIGITKNLRTTEHLGLGAVGRPEVLAAAYAAGEQVTITGKQFTGERVYLGVTRETFDLDRDAVALQRIGLDQEFISQGGPYKGERLAVYLIDMERLDDAPGIAEAYRQAKAARTQRLLDMQARVDAEDERLDRLAEDGA
ncbi:hypothetical protein [Streptomyces sp. LS1784]|uniref:hypothetical protein n=1 Tax=Streptomyces sp. LS1784 TaxID=2851533 RepID=UPI001CCF6102|nr:hypothetical protein [Streptomyces sp. LS1784]